MKNVKDAGAFAQAVLTALCLCYLSVPMSLLAQSSAAAASQGWLRSGQFIGEFDLHPDFAASLQKSGNRMTSTAKGFTNVTGTLTGQSGTRDVAITIQAPGYLRYEDALGGVVVFDGQQFVHKGGGHLATDETQIADSLLAAFPDAIFLQLARSGSLLRRVGSGFRTDDGRTPNYRGPWWTLYAFRPAAWQGLSKGDLLQQELLIAIDEQTGLLAEVRVITGYGTPSQKVVQTQFTSWLHQADQAYPGTITRLENGKAVFSLQVKQATVGATVGVNAITAH